MQFKFFRAPACPKPLLFRAIGTTWVDEEVGSASTYSCHSFRPMVFSLVNTKRMFVVASSAGLLNGTLLGLLELKWKSGIFRPLEKGLSLSRAKFFLTTSSIG